MTLFDHAEAERRKVAGIAAATSPEHRKAVLAAAQQAAFELAQRFGEVDSDMVAARVESMGFDYAALGNAAGATFKNAPHPYKWVWTGRARASERVSTHGRVIRVWRLGRTVA